MYVSGMAIESEGLLVQVEASRADVLLLDWHLPGVSTMNLLADIQGLRYPPKIVVLSIKSEDKRPALSAGAFAFISKNKPPEELLETVRSVRETTVNSTE
jgi:DNA-binding NarL/FixJ family response regulator